MMFKSLLIISFYFATVMSNVYGKSTDKGGISPFDCFNNFQRFTGDSMNADSALFYIRKLADIPTTQASELLRNLMHQSFAQAFLRSQETATTSKEDSLVMVRTAFSAQLLQRMMADTCQELKKVAKPLWQWYQVQQAGANTDSIKSLTQTFLKDQMSPEDLYENSTGRYALLIHQLIASRSELKSLADTLYQRVSIYLKENQITLVDSLKRPELMKRAWSRGLYAYINYKLSETAKTDFEKDSLLRIAFVNSPDLTDQNNASAYFYDMHFLVGGGKDGFQDDYISFLTQPGKENKSVLPILIALSLSQPAYKKKLEAYYNSHKTVAMKSFTKFWMNAVDSSAAKAPSILLTQINKAVFSTKQQIGKWILLDFWGTWCSPCRKEHPQLQDFYKSTVLKKPKSISLLTIACRDFKPNVIQYMKSNKYFFPVAMSDNKIEGIYRVQGYPTKILITPKGRYIIVPFGLDWVQFVKDYTSI